MNISKSVSDRNFSIFDPRNFERNDFNRTENNRIKIFG